MADLATIILSVLTSSTVTGLLTLAIQERIRRSVKLEYDAKLEHIRGDLRVDAFQRETRFGKLHEARSVAIAKIYGLLRRFRHEVNRAVNPHFDGLAPTAENTAMLGELADALTRLERYFYPRAILLPRQIASEIEALIHGYYGSVRKFQHEGRTPEEHKKPERWIAIINEVRQDHEAAFQKIEGDLRSVLGDEAPVSVA